jgi:hypothetical protein
MRLMTSILDVYISGDLYEGNSIFGLFSVVDSSIPC